MEIVYSIIDTLLPFEWSRYTFMKNAFIAIIIISPLFAMLGTMVINNKMAFFSDSVGHSALTGVALGVIMGLKNHLIAIIIFSIFFAVIITLLKAKTTNSTDTIIGVVNSVSVALGIVILSKDGNFSKYSYFLIGDILSINVKDITMIFILALFILVIWLLFFNNFLLVSINSSLANSKKNNVLLIDLVFTIIIALVVSISIQWVGIMIINSLLILPAAISRNISKSIFQYTNFSILISLFAGIAGLVVSFYISTATGATIVLVLGLIYLFSIIFTGISSIIDNKSLIK